jgi:hypothetical protein
VTKKRSPNYPSLTLFEAIDKVRKVYNSEHTHPANKDVVAKDLGYGTLNGASLTAIGALKRYGLLEDAGDGLRVTANAVTLLEVEDDQPSYKLAARTAAFAPTFFSELRNEYGDKLPSDGNLRHQLIKKGFLPRAADEVIRIYRDNLELVDDAQEEYDEVEMVTLPPAAENPKTMRQIEQKDMEISLPVGTADNGEIVFATVRFSAGIKRNLVASLRVLLEAMEKTLPEPVQQ